MNPLPGPLQDLASAGRARPNDGEHLLNLLSEAIRRPPG